MSDPAPLPISEVSFVLPEPPSTNALFRNVSASERRTAKAHGKLLRGRTKTAAYKAWQKTAGWEMRAQRHPLPYFPGKVAMEIYLSDKTRLDADNLKAIADLFTLMGVIEDDSLVSEYLVSKKSYFNKGFCGVVVRRL